MNRFETLSDKLTSHEPIRREHCARPVTNHCFTFPAFEEVHKNWSSYSGILLHTKTSYKIYLLNSPHQVCFDFPKIDLKKCQLAITNFCHFLWNKSSPSERYSLFETLIIWRYMSLNHTRSATFSYNMKLHWAYLAISPDIIITIIIMMITMVYLTDPRDGSSLFNYSICNYR